MLMPYKRYAEFDGRSRRKEYWMFTLLYVIVYAICLVFGGVLAGEDPSGGIGMIFVLALVVFVVGSFIPSLAVTVRRLHDTDRSGWWILISLVPLVGPIVLLVFTVMDGTPGANKFGSSPKGERTAEVFA